MSGKQKSKNKPKPQFEGKPKPTGDFNSADALKSKPFIAPNGSIMIKCPYCLGNGKTYGWECPACKGHKVIDQRTFRYPEGDKV